MLLNITRRKRLYFKILSTKNEANLLPSNHELGSKKVILGPENQKNNKKLINPLIIRIMYLCPLINHLYFITMNKGIVKFFNESKGFGFIKDESTGKEYFVHVSGLTEKVKENDEVTFELIEGRKGLNAVNVRRA